LGRLLQRDRCRSRRPRRAFGPDRRRHRVRTGDYRRAPEDPFPAALQDAIHPYRGLLDSGLPSEKIVVAGGSAGGGLAVAVAQQAPVRGLPRPAGIYAISPWADLTQTNASYHTRGPHDPVLSRTALQDLARIYLNGADPRSPLHPPSSGTSRDSHRCCFMWEPTRHCSTTPWH
ncbi:MAG TPA: alpha/beta hydrolase fold domain-containing protein, partial [Pseudonocardiaceae bacterium]|nr:alpha/beta hydrolase fold domain-containing protein [Pseudonocardiaceae bacterium]